MFTTSAVPGSSRRQHSRSSATHDTWNVRDGALIAYAHAPPAPWISYVQLRLHSGGGTRQQAGLTAYRGPDGAMPSFIYGPISDWGSNGAGAMFRRFPGAAAWSTVTGSNPYSDSSADAYSWCWYRMAMDAAGVLTGGHTCAEAESETPPGSGWTHGAWSLELGAAHAPERVGLVHKTSCTGAGDGDQRRARPRKKKRTREEKQRRRQEREAKDGPST